jgi:hypothetical protein
MSYRNPTAVRRTGSCRCRTRKRIVQGEEQSIAQQAKAVLKTRVEATAGHLFPGEVDPGRPAVKISGAHNRAVAKSGIAPHRAPFGAWPLPGEDPGVQPHGSAASYRL